MPPDSSRTSSSRRTQRKITEEELRDIELKRIRGELSCAECRRLKLRCDKKVPCSSCCRRGCESICPCGILSAGQGTRFILADTEQLHRKISDMSHRIRQLEDALAIMQSAVSAERHPLLQDELLKVKFGPEAPESRQFSSGEVENETKPSIDALGTLTLGDSGEVKYFGRSAGSETLMMAEEEYDSSSDDEDEKNRIALTPELEKVANLFPFTVKHRPNTHTLELLESFLPSHERAWFLGDSYLNHAAYFFRPIKRDELLNTHLPAIYSTATSRTKAHIVTDSPDADNSSDLESVDSTSPHALATIFFIFALGALLDLNLPPYNAEAEHYYDLGRAALSLRTVFESPQLDTVQALGLMATYHSLAGKKYSRDSAWCVMSFVAKLAQSIGLHRDSARWHMDPKMVQKRRTLFWEVFSADVSHSLALGRPPAINLSYVDCELPVDEEATLSDSGEVQNGFWRMKYTFAKNMFFAVAEATLTATSPSYSTVLDLDRKVREITFPTSFKPYVLREDGEQEYFSSSLSLQGFYASQHRTVTMLYLHRSFFAQAMLDHPSNPLLSPFAPSFLTAYRCASVIIKASAHQFDRCAEMAMRVWFLMYHTFSAAVIVGTVVTRSPNSSVAASALLDLTRAVDLFERTALQSQRAKIALGVLRKLQEKAIRSYAQYCSTQPTPPNTNATKLVSSFSGQKTDDLDDDLAIFGGQKRVLSRKSRIKNSPTSTSEEPPSPPSSVSSPNIRELMDLNPNGNLLSMADVHPSLVEYLGHGSFSAEELTFPPTHITSSTPAIPRTTVSTGPQTKADATPTATSFPNTTPSIEDAYSAFMGYIANTPLKTMNGTPTGPPNTLPSTVSSSYQVSEPGGWDRQLVEDTTGLPQVDNSFGWLPPPPRQQNFAPAVPPVNNGFNGRYEPAMPQFSPPVAGLSPPSQQYFGQQDQYLRNSYMNASAPPAAPAGAMFELGLLTESEIDSGWFSFMQDCGIMDTSGSNGTQG